MFHIPLSENVLGLRISAFNRAEASYVDNPFNSEAANKKARINGERVAVHWEVNAELVG